MIEFLSRTGVVWWKISLNFHSLFKFDTMYTWPAGFTFCLLKSMQTEKNVMGFV